MANLKVIIFQKNINSDLSKDQKLKISAAKADFLILPRFFPYFETPREGIELKESFYLDKILEISEYHKGVVIGGSIFRKVDGVYVESIPIVKDVTLVDYYNVRTGGKIGGLTLSSQEGDSIYILHGARFSILPGPDILEESQMSYLKNEKIELDELVKIYLTIRREREILAQQFEAKDAELKGEMASIEHVMLAECNSINAESIKTGNGTGP
jgi:hypothetical protein